MKKILTLALVLLATGAFAADTKISALANGAPAQTTDAVPIQRGAGNNKLLLSEFCLLNSTCDLAAAVQLRWSTDTGLARSAAGVVRVTNGSTGDGSIAAGTFQSPSAAATKGLLAGTAVGGIKLGFGNALNWTTTGDANGAADVGITRSAAGVVRHTDGSTGLGYGIGGTSVEANIATKAPTVIESGELYTNTGDADGSTINLPDNPTIGTQYEFAVRVAQTMTINAATGETIQDAGTNGTTTASSTVGSTMRLVAITGGSGAVWQVMFKTGTWTTS